MSEKLFKKEYEEKKKEDKEKIKNPNLVVLLKIYKKLNWILLWITVILNSILLVIMMSNFNVGIILFILNQYFIINLFVKTRKELIEKKKKLMVYDES